MIVDPAFGQLPKNGVLGNNRDLVSANRTLRELLEDHSFRTLKAQSLTCHLAFSA